MRPSPPDPTPPRLLVIDDEEGNRLWLQRRLGAEGFAIDAVCGGAEGVQRLRERRYDLVLLDLAMPQMDGLSTLDAIKSDPGLAGVPVAMLTASNAHACVAQALSLGAVDYVLKPFRLPDLLRRLRRLLAGTARGSAGG